MDEIKEKELDPIEEKELDPVEEKPLSLGAKLLRQALGYDDMTPINLTKHVSIACKTSTGKNTKVELEEDAPTLRFFSNGKDVASSLKISVLPVQDGTGDPSPENPRDISGWSEVNIWQAAEYDEDADPTYVISLGDTYYSGELDVVAGVLRVNMVGITPAVFNLQSTNSHGIANFQFSISPDADGKSAARAKAICNVLKTQNEPIAGITEPGIMVANATNGYLRLESSDAATVDAANTWVSENNVLLLYYLAEPIEVTVTPEIVEILSGENNFWADCGPVTELVY